MGTPAASAGMVAGEPATRTAWYALGVLLVAYTLSFIDRTILALLVQPIQRDLGVSDTQISLLHGLAFAIFYTFLGIPIARAADRHSRRSIISVGIAVWSLATAVCGLARNFWELFLARIMVGVGEAALSPAAYSMLTDYFPKDKLGRALGVYQVGAFGGAGLAFMIGGTVIAATSDLVVHVPLVGEAAGWQLAFWIVGLPGVLVALWMMTVPEPPRKGRTSTAAVPIADVVRHLRVNLRTYGGHFAGFSLIGLVFNGFVAWIPTLFIRRHELATSEVGLWVGGALFLFGSIGIICGGLLSDALTRRGRTDATLLAGLLGGVLMIPFAVAGPLMPTPGLALMAFAGFFFFSSFPFAGAVAAIQLVTPATMRAQASALFLFCLNMIGIGFGPTAIALLTDVGFGDQMMIHLSLAIVAAVAGPLGCLAVWSGLAPFRRSLAPAEPAPTIGAPQT